MVNVLNVLNTVKLVLQLIPVQHAILISQLILLVLSEIVFVQLDIIYLFLDLVFLVPNKLQMFKSVKSLLAHNVMEITHSV